MKDLQDKVAVVTGAASGIGRALAERFLDEGMRVVASDVETERLEATAAELRERSAQDRVAAIACDVSDAAAVEALAEASYAAFGRVDIVCNNAGVLSGGFSWETPLEDWDWVLGVNLYGVIHGLRSFVPRLQAQGSEAHIVNVASMAGLTTVPMAGVYHVSKHGVLALSECLHKELSSTGSNVKVSVLCPEMINTGIGDSERNRPERLRTETSSPMKDLIVKSTSEAARQGLDPSVMADRVVQAIREERFYILAEDDVWRDMCNTRLDDIREGRNPTLALPVAD